MSLQHKTSAGGSENPSPTLPEPMRRRVSRTIELGANGFALVELPSAPALIELENLIRASDGICIEFSRQPSGLWTHGVFDDLVAGRPLPAPCKAILIKIDPSTPIEKIDGSFFALFNDRRNLIFKAMSGRDIPIFIATIGETQYHALDEALVKMIDLRTLRTTPIRPNQ